MDQSIQVIAPDDTILQFTNQACDCEVDKIHPSKGLTKYIFRLYPTGGVLDFTYTNKHGLRNKQHDASDKRNAVLFDLLEIKDGDVKAVEKFIKKHGFLLRLNPQNDNAIEAEHLFVLINRLQATVSLMSHLCERNINYEQVLAQTMYLLLSPQIQIGLPSQDNPFSTYLHEIGYLWYNVDVDINNVHEYEDDGEYGGHWVDDSIRPPQTLICFSDYIEALDWPDYINSKIIYFFRNATEVGYECRLAIDFLYHFFKDVGKIEQWNHKGELTFTAGSPSSSERFQNQGFDTPLKEGLIKIAKNTLKAEMEWNLGGIVPSYNIELMVPSWRVGYLLSGLYFSVFSMRPNIEIYKTCANLNCRKPFQATSPKRKYCNRKCANAAMQANYRRKKRNQ